MGGLSHAVSGDIASFRTPSRVPIESLKFHFLPKQEGSGDASPVNIRNIVGWTGLNGKKSNKGSLFEQGGLVDNNGTSSTASTRIRTDFIPYNGEAQLIFDGKGFENDDQIRAIYWYNSSKSFISMSMLSTAMPYTYTVPSNSSFAYFRIVLWKTVSTDSISPTGKWLSVNQSLIPIVFPTSGKNLVNDEVTTIRGSMSKSGRTYTSTATDNRGYIQLYVQTLDANNNQLYLKTYTILTIGRNSFTFTVDNPKTRKIMFKHNGKSKDMGIYIPWDGRLGTYTISVNFESLDITTVGGFVFSDVQIELGDTATAYEPYSPDNTFYGGYYDPVAGEIVAEWAKQICNGSEKNSWSSSGTYTGLKRWILNISPKPINSSTSTVKFNYFKPSSTSAQWNAFVGSTGNFLFFVPDNIGGTKQDWCDYLEENPLEICYQLAEPIHIPVASQDLKAFLDYNNFWSDANDITEVTYAVTESKDILATRKKAMDFDMGHHKKVMLNQWAPAVTGNKYASYNSNKISVSVEDGIITQTFLAVEYSYRGSVTTPSNMKKHALNRYYYLSYEYCTDFVGKIGGTVGGQYLMNYVKTTQANVWDRFSGIVKRTEGGTFDNYVVYLGWFNESTGIEIGSTCQMRNPIAIDLTQMFGEGNEPTTKAKFEKLCAINGLDLTTYHPIDSGTEMYWIIP